MLKWVKKLFLIGPEFTKEEYEEFERTRKELNIQRCKTASYFLLTLNMALILVDQLLYKPMRGLTPAYTYLFYSHIFLSALIILWLLVIELIIPQVKNSKYSLMLYIFLNIVVYWCVFMGINGLRISGQMLAYIICVLALSVFIYLSPVESFAMYFSSLLILAVGLFFLIKDHKILYNNIVNVSIAILCSCIISKINYSSLKKDFLSKKIIISSKMELEASNVKLKECEKIKSDFFANISHELRTPLNIIYSSQQMIENILLRKNENDAKLNKYFKMMKQNSFRLIKLVGNIIDMTKIDATIYEIKPINCDIITLVENITMSTIGYIESKGISMTFDTEVEEKIISCDPEKIERIMLNLLSNSIKFTQINGSIFVNIYLKNDKVNISVRDTGIGIPKEMKDLIFDRFIQVDKSINRNREGSGIGLSLVKSLVEMHNGSISVNSILGQGSEFIVTLPDIIIDGSCRDGYLDCLNDQRVERINIEFSDIYE